MGNSWIGLVDYVSEANDITTRYYHDGSNAAVEYVDDDGTGLALARSYVHGKQYVDERAVVHDHENGEEYYYTLSDLFTVDGLINGIGHEVERYTYDAYGKAVVTIIKAQDIDYSGAVGTGDRNLIYANYGAVNCSSASVLCDLDESGFVGTGDVNLVNANYTINALATSPRSSVGNPYLFTGRTTDLIHDGGSPAISLALQDNRARTYNPHHGRWLQRDPAMYVDGMNLYQYVSGRPAELVDGMGLWGDDVHYSMTIQWILKEKVPYEYAELIGFENKMTDQGSTGPYPWQDQSWHFNRTPGAWDSRLQHKSDMLKKAKLLCDPDWDDPRGAARCMGRGMHAIQDYWAHGEYTTGPNPTWIPHDALGKGYDEPHLDARGVPNGRPPQIRWYPDTKIGGPLMWVDIPWTDWVGGTKRINRSQQNTLGMLRTFLSYVRSEGGCYCKEAFLPPT